MTRLPQLTVRELWFNSLRVKVSLKTANLEVI